MIDELEASQEGHKDALLVLDEDAEQEFEDEDHEDDDEGDEYQRHKKVTEHDEQFIDEYERMMEQFRKPTVKKTKMNNLKHASVLAQNVVKKQKKEQFRKPTVKKT